MLAKDISEALHRVSASLKQFRDVNSGGCGVVAACVSRELTDHGVRNEIVTNRDEFFGTNVTDARLNVRNPFSMAEWEENGIYFGHVAVKVWLNDHAVGVYDSEGFIDARLNIFPAFGDLEVAEGSFTLEEMEAFIRQRSHWNPEFDRAQIPRMRIAIHKAFKAFNQGVES